MTIHHDLTHDELADLIGMVKRGRCKWHWVGFGGLGGRLNSPALEHDGTHITSVSADGDHDSHVVVRAVYNAYLRLRERRSKAAKKAAETRRQRTEAHVYHYARRLRDGGKFPPSTHCNVCRRGLTDQPSLDRGIGSDCWQKILRQLEHFKRAERQATDEAAALF